MPKEGIPEKDVGIDHRTRLERGPEGAAVSEDDDSSQLEHRGFAGNLFKCAKKEETMSESKGEPESCRGRIYSLP